MAAAPVASKSTLAYDKLTFLDTGSNTVDIKGSSLIDTLLPANSYGKIYLQSSLFGGTGKVLLSNLKDGISGTDAAA